MERRVLLAVLLSFVVLYGYQLLFPPPPEPKPAATGQPAAPNPTAPKTEQATPAAKPTAEAVPRQVSPATALRTSDVNARDIVVENGAVRAVFTTQGAALKSWRLKKYRDSAGEPLELVATHAPADMPLPFTLQTDDGPATNALASAAFTPSADALSIDSGTRTLQFDFKDGSGIEARKTFTFTADRPYSIGVTADVKRAGQALPLTIAWGPAIGSGIVQKSRTYNPASQPVFYRDGKVSRVSVDKIPAQPVQEGTFGFVGVDDHYFLVALVTPKQQPLHVTYQPLAVSVPDAPEGAHYVSWATRFPSSPQDETYFLGPKDFDVLVAVNRDLVRAIDFGMFAWLVVPLLRSLKWINGYVGNYGWSLIILTVLINVAMFPLRHKSVVSMRKMQEVQPEVKAIQDRYAKLKMSDPARSKMNVELMNLYRERGVNPASGCVPMLLTMPVLFAFYSMLSVAIELRGAPFIGWIHDLSAHDPLFITPVLMGVTMMIQQKMTPSTADPVQQKMMLIMPVVMTGMFLWAASGLVLYWTVSNIWGIGQQMITNRLIGPTPQRTVRPPAERRVKRVGGGRTDQAKGNQ
jgi:YidC/Oxa1 family membrane protein insertase